MKAAGHDLDVRVQPVQRAADALRVGQREMQGARGPHRQPADDGGAVAWRVDLLDANGFSEANLRRAYGSARNADIAAEVAVYGQLRLFYRQDPALGLLSTSIVPPCASTICRACAPRSCSACPPCPAAPRAP